MAPKTYTALVGINYPTAKGEARVEAGEKVTDLPAKSVSWLLANGLITDGKAPKPAADDAADTADDATVEVEEADD